MNNVNNSNNTNQLPSYRELLQSVGLSDESTQNRVHNMVTTGSTYFPHNILPSFHDFHGIYAQPHLLETQHTTLSIGQEPDEVMMEDDISGNNPDSYFQDIQENLQRIEDDLFAAVQASWRPEELRCFFKISNLANAEIAEKIGSFKTEADVEALKSQIIKAIDLYYILFPGTPPTDQWLGIEDQLIAFARNLSIPSEIIQHIMTWRTVQDIRARRQELFPWSIRVNPWAILQARGDDVIPTLWRFNQ